MCNAKQKHRFSAMAMALLVSVSLLPAAVLAAPGPGQKTWRLRPAAPTTAPRLLRLRICTLPWPRM